jgi:hypothetical protein
VIIKVLVQILSRTKSSNSGTTGAEKLNGKSSYAILDMIAEY